MQDNQIIFQLLEQNKMLLDELRELRNEHKELRTELKTINKVLKFKAAKVSTKETKEDILATFRANQLLK